jgi:hypothetical protein
LTWHFPKKRTQLFLSGNLSSLREIFSHVARALSFSRAIPSPVARSFAAIDLRDQLDAAAARGLRRLPHGREPQQDDGIVVQERHGEDAAMDLLASRRCKKRRRRWISSSLREERRWRAKKGGGARGKEKSHARGGVVSRETTATWGLRTRQGV